MIRIIDLRFDLTYDPQFTDRYKAVEETRRAALIAECGDLYAPMLVSSSGHRNNIGQEMETGLAGMRKEAAKMIRAYRRARSHARTNPKEGGSVITIPALITIENFGFGIYGNRQSEIITHFCQAEGCAHPYYLERPRTTFNMYHAPEEERPGSN